MKWTIAVPSPHGYASGRHQRSTSVADDIDFEIKGTDAQYVEVELDPGESAVAETGSMMFKDADIRMDTAFGDGSAASSGGGLFDKLVGAGKRLITGESLFTTVFTHQGRGKARLAFAAPYPGHILPVRLEEMGGKFICQKDAFLCAARGVSIGIHFQKRVMTGLFGGDGWVFVHIGGSVIERTLASGEELHVDAGCVAAMTASVDFDLVRAGSVKSMIFGGEGVFFAKLTGPGEVWIQSLPFSRLAGRMLSAAPQKGGSKGEGSMLGGLGDLLDGDNR